MNAKTQDTALFHKLSRKYHQQVKTEDKCTISTQTRVNWKKVYQDLYAALAKQRFPQIKITANTVYDLEKAVTSVNQVLSKCADDAAPRQHRWTRKTKLRVWTPEIKAAFIGKKNAFYC